MDTAPDRIRNLPHGIRVEIRLTPCHRDVGVPEQVTHDETGDTGLAGIGADRVPQVVKPNILDARPPSKPRPGAFQRLA